MREVVVKTTWQATDTIEVPDDTPRLASDDLSGVLDASDGEDVTPLGAELTDWEVIDRR